MPIHTTICWNWAAWSSFKTEKAVACGNVHQLSETAKGDIDAYEPITCNTLLVKHVDWNREVLKPCAFSDSFLDLICSRLPSLKLAPTRDTLETIMGLDQAYREKKVMTRRDLVKGAGENE